MSLLMVNYETSTITLADREFPCVGLVCPPHPLDGARSRRDRSLGGPGGRGTKASPANFMAYVPCENGLMVSLDAVRGESTLDISLHSQKRGLYREMGETMWLPLAIEVRGKMLAPETFNGIVRRKHARSSWRDAEPEWTAELIDRLGKMQILWDHEGAPLAEMLSLPDLMDLLGQPVPGHLDA